MRVFYFGADDTWEKILQKGFRRRNTCILKALSEQENISQVFTLRKSSRSLFWRSLFNPSVPNTQSKVVDLEFASPFPEKIMKTLGLEWLNRNLAAWSIYRRVGKSAQKDILWGYWPKGFKVLYDSGLKGYTVFDADHNIIDDPNIGDSEKPAREAELMWIGKQASCIVSSVQSMIDWYHQKGFPQAKRLRNGIEADRIVMHPEKQGSEIVIGYCGTLSRWINYQQFEALVNRHPNWIFRIIGKPYMTEDWRVLENKPNVELLGEKGPKEAAEIMRSFSVGINVYQYHPALDVDSMKLYDYLAAGTPVVSSRFHQTLENDFDGLLLLGDALEDVEAQIEKVTVAHWSMPESDRLKFLKNAVWKVRIADFLQTIK